MRRGWILVAMALITVFSLSRGLNGPSFHLALEDRFDPNPRQIAVDAEIAGLALALAISWTQRTAR